MFLSYIFVYISNKAESITVMGGGVNNRHDKAIHIDLFGDSIGFKYFKSWV